MIPSKRKYHFFYIINDDENRDLYAYTDDDTLAARFKYERSKDKFVEKVHKCTSDEIKKITENYPGMFIEILERKTKKRTHGSKIINISIAATVNEIMTISSYFDSLINIEFMSWARHTPVKFNADIIDALAYIDYIEWYKLFECMDITIGLDDYDIDIFGAFLYFYGKLLDGDK